MAETEAIMTYGFLAERRSKDSFATLVQFGHDDVLCLIGRSLCGKVDDVWFVHLLV
jgi:hypothetical protein